MILPVLLPTALVLPAASLCLTWTLPAVYVPAGRLIMLPVPVSQVEPLSRLYCQAAPATKPLTLILPLLVVPSLFELPVSTASAKVGVAIAVARSILKASLAPVVLPAASVALTVKLCAPAAMADAGV